MTTAEDISDMAERLRAMLAQKFRFKARDLPRALSKAGRRLPRKLHVQAQVIVEAQKLGGNPKLMRRVDMDAVSHAHDAISAYLAKIDPEDVRRGRRLALLGDIAAKLLIIVAAFVVWLWWTGKL